MDKELTGSYYYSLFKFFSDEYSLTLLDSDIQEIIYEVNKFQQIDQEKKIEAIEFAKWIERRGISLSAGRHTYKQLYDIYKPIKQNK